MHRTPPCAERCLIIVPLIHTTIGSGIKKMLHVQVTKSSPGSFSKPAKATQSVASPALRFILLTSITVMLWTGGPFLCWLPEGHTPPHSVPPLSSLDFLPSPHRKHCPVATSHFSTSPSSHVKTTRTCRDHTAAASFLEDHAPCPPLFLPLRSAHLHDRDHVLLLGAQISALPPSFPDTTFSPDDFTSRNNISCRP